MVSSILSEQGDSFCFDGFFTISSEKPVEMVSRLVFVRNGGRNLKRMV